MIFSTILPGVRQLRAPLAAGYVWILFICLAAHVTEVSPRSEFTRELVDLAHTLSAIGLAVAVSFAAYLIGSLSQWIFSVLGSILFRRSRRRALLSERGQETLDDLLASRVAAGVLSKAADAGHLAKEVMNDLALTKTRLLGVHNELYEEIDRLQAEAEFRAALLPPLSAVLTLAVFEIPGGALPSELPAWLLLFGVALLAELIGFQIIALVQQANDKVVDALLLERVSSPALDRWERESRPADWE